MDSFEKRREASLRAASALGIVDVVQASTNDGISLDTLDLAIRITKKNAAALYEEAEKTRNLQENDSSN